MRVDLNADMGESAERWASGEDRNLLTVVTSANVCCGAYAGDDELIRATCQLAVQHGVAIGAQVGYPDRAGFGRVPLDIGGDELAAEVARQIAHLWAMARSVGGDVAYVKPHGALYHRIASDREQAQAVVDAAAESTLPLLGLPGSASLELAAARDVRAVTEGFADRAYTLNGTLVPRTEQGAVLTDTMAVTGQAVRLLRADVESICIHSDSPGALDLARAVRRALGVAGAAIEKFT